MTTISISAAFGAIGALAFLAGALLFLLLRESRRNGRLEKRIAAMARALAQKDKQLRAAAEHRIGSGGRGLGSSSF